MYPSRNSLLTYVVKSMCTANMGLLLRFICNCIVQYKISTHLIFYHFRLDSKQKDVQTVSKEININRCSSDHCNLLNHAVPSDDLLRLEGRKATRHLGSISFKRH